MTSVAIIYRKDKLNKKGEAPVHFRLIKDRKVRYISSGYMVPERHWDSEKNCVNRKHKNSARLNAYLARKASEFTDEVLDQEKKHKSLTSRQLRDKIIGKKPTDFFTFADEANQRYLSEGKIGSYDKNASIIQKLREYLKGSTIDLQDVDQEFLSKYEKHLRQTLKNKINTVHKDLKFFRKLFNDAQRQDIIEYQQNPFNKYKLNTEKTQRTYLTKEELFKIEKLKVTPGTRLELHRNMFVFATYAGGLRVSDILQLQWKHFDKERINFTVKKTGVQLSIKLPNKALALLKKYQPKKIDHNSFVFPQLPEKIDLNDPREVDTAISRSTAYIDKNLRIIAEKTKLEKKLSFHISRHTFGMMALDMDIPLETIQGIYGHQNIRETQIYAKIKNTKRDKAMEKFNQK